jgi:hypothetical protein
MRYLENVLSFFVKNDFWKALNGNFKYYELRMKRKACKNDPILTTSVETIG